MERASVCKEVEHFNFFGASDAKTLEQPKYRDVRLDKIGGGGADKLNGRRWLLAIYVTVTYKIMINHKKSCRIRVHHYEIH